MNKLHGLYKFVFCETDEIIYIGKSNSNLKNRIETHIRGKGLDEKFNAYKGKCKVYVAFLPNPTETDIMERALINLYKPILNVTDNYAGLSNLIRIVEPRWIAFDEAFPKPSELREKTKITRKNTGDDVFIGHAFGKEFYLTNNYEYWENGKKGVAQYFASSEEALAYVRDTIFICKEFSESADDEDTYTILPKNCKQFNYLWKYKHGGLGPGLVVRERKSISFSAIILTIYSDGHEVERVKFSTATVDMLASVMEELSRSENCT